MFGFTNLTFLFILLVSVCNGAPATTIDELSKRYATSMSATSLHDVSPSLERRQGGGGRPGGPPNGMPNMPPPPNMPNPPNFNMPGQGGNNNGRNNNNNNNHNGNHNNNNNNNNNRNGNGNGGRPF